MRMVEHVQEMYRWSRTLAGPEAAVWPDEEGKREETFRKVWAYGVCRQWWRAA